MAFISGVPAVFPGLFLCWCESAQSQATLQIKYHGNSTSSSLTCLSAHSGHNFNEVAEMPDVTMITPLKRQVCHHLVLQVTPPLMMNWRYTGRFACSSFRWYSFSLSKICGWTLYLGLVLTLQSRTHTYWVRSSFGLTEKHNQCCLSIFHTSSPSSLHLVFVDLAVKKECYFHLTCYLTVQLTVYDSFR